MQSREKIYLIPREVYDSCILRDTEKFATYSYELIIQAIFDQWIEEYDNRIEDCFEAVVEYYDYNILPLASMFNIKFETEDDETTDFE